MRRSLESLSPGLAVMAAVLLAAPAAAGFSDLAGRWVSEPLAIEDAPECAPGTISVEIGEDASLRVEAGPAVSLDVRLVRDQTHPVYVEPAGWMKRFGMSDATTRDSLIDHKPILWARETEEGAVVYRVRISEAGTLDLMRLALEPVEGAIAATLEMTAGPCRLDPVTTSLMPR